MTISGASAWPMAVLALDLLAVDPTGLGGVSVRARAGPVRDAALSALRRLPGSLERIHPAMPREALFGGIDLTATLTSGKIMKTQGLLGDGVTPVLAMAERCGRDLAAELAAWMDRTNGAMILLDEGAEPGETAPAALLERVAFRVSLDQIGRLEATPPPSRDYDSARAGLTLVKTPKSCAATLTGLAARLGVDSLRGPLFAVRAARALAALDRRDRISDGDIETAAALVLAPRATRLPTPPEDLEHDAAPEREPQNAPGDGDTNAVPDDILVEAIRPFLPPDVLDGLTLRASKSAKGVGAGQVRKSNRRGRPLPSRPGRLGLGARVDLVATLRTAAPWQVLRHRGDGPVKVLPSDIRVRRYEEKSDRVLIFAVDASGSAAMARLAEAKGAVEILLADAYASRDHVALIAFKGDAAELLLPPTRSLVQTKRRLAGLPGGGGTPLAAGLRAAGELALHARGQGLTPTLALLTDGRANIALDGRANREAAAQDATVMARWLNGEGVPAVVLDTGARPSRALQTLSADLAAHYIPLPRADAHAMGRVLGQAMHDGLGA